MSLLLGVDGGATKTVALIADRSGTVLGAGRAGSSDIHNEASAGIAIDHVVASVAEALAVAGVAPGDLGACVFGLCGSDWPEDVAFYVATLSQRLRLTSKPMVTNDAFNSLRAGTDDGIGVALVMGTGAAIAARGRDGQTWFSGERMERAGAVELGRHAYDMLIRSEYGSGAQPGFCEAALRVFDVDSVDALVYAITRTGGLGHRSVARLAPLLLEASHGGDRECGRLVREQGALLAGYVSRAAERVGISPEETVVVLAGGVFKHHGTDLRDAITAALPGYRVEATPLEPAHGAVLLAADHDGVRLDTARLRSTGPSATFFDTEAAA